MDRRYFAEGIFDFAMTRSKRSFDICAAFASSGVKAGNDATGRFSATNAVGRGAFFFAAGAGAADAVSFSFSAALVNAGEELASNSLKPWFARLVAAETAASSRGARSRNAKCERAP